MFIILLILFIIPVTVIFFQIGLSMVKYMPLVVLGGLIYFNWDTISLWMHAIYSYSLLWIVGALVIALIISKPTGFYGKLIICTIAVGAAAVIPVILESQKVAHPFEKMQIVEAVASRSQGDQIGISSEDLEACQSMLAGLELRHDPLHQASNLKRTADRSWYVLEATAADGSSLMVTFFPDGEKEYIRLKYDEKTSCYIGDKTGGSWVNGKLSEAKHAYVLANRYQDLRTLKNSFSYTNGVASFTVPVDDFDIEIVALPDGGNALSFLEDTRFAANETYTFEIPEKSYRYFYLTVRVEGETFYVINIFDLLPLNMQSSDPQDRFIEEGI